MKILAFVFFCVVSFLNSSFSWAWDLLPYAQRTNRFNDWGTTLLYGDIRTVGMAGATLGIADSFGASLNNPAGLAMVLGNADLHLTTNEIHNRNVQETSISTSDFGLAVNLYPWGFSFGSTLPSVEGQTYALDSAPDVPLGPLVTIREFQLSAARVFFENKVAFGLSMIWGQAQNRLTLVNSNSSVSTNASTLGAVLGTSIQITHHLLLGVSYRFPMHYSMNTQDNPTPSLPDLLQSIDSAQRAGFGLGWMPNRFFKADFSIFVVGRTDQVALLKDDSLKVGQSVSVQPRLGVAYTFLDYPELTSSIYAGTYFEPARIQDTPDRLHGTMGFNLNPWILTFGMGFDLSYKYHNYLFGIGIDVIRTMEKLDLIPKLPRPRPAGFAPNIAHISHEGLPRPLAGDWRPPGPDLDPIKIGLEIPKRAEKKVEKLGKEIEEGFFRLFKKKPKKSKSPKKPKKKGPHPAEPKKTI